MATILLNRFKDNGFRTGIRTVYCELEMSLKMILNEYLSVPEGSFEYVIPGALINLVIL